MRERSKVIGLSRKGEFFKEMFEVFVRSMLKFNDFVSLDSKFFFVISSTDLLLFLVSLSTSILGDSSHSSLFSMLRFSNCVFKTFLGTGATICGEDFIYSGTIAKWFAFIGLAICLFEWPSGDFFEIIYLAFDSISIPMRVEMDSIPSRSSLIFLSWADENPPLISHVFEYPPNSSVLVCYFI